MHQRFLAPILDLFRQRDGRIAWWVVAAFVAIQVVVFSNARRHDPRIGYDANAHRAYAKVLAREHRLPTDRETNEFFSPPLPYVPVAILRALNDADADPGRQRGDEAAKIAQLIQATLSIPLTLSVMALVRAARPRRDAFAVGCALLCIGILPVYYRSFAMIRGEPPMTTFAMLGTLVVVRTFALSSRPTIRAGALAGVLLGLACLSRQWAFFVLPVLGGLGLWRLIIDVANRRSTLLAGCATLVCAAILAGPFYASLYSRYGTIRAFNREPIVGAVDAPSTSIPLTTALSNLVNRPVRDRLVDHPALLFYADVWGDYWQYFLVNAVDRKGNNVSAVDIERASTDGSAKSNNFESMSSYLGRVNVLAIVPAATMSVGLIAALFGLRRFPLGTINRRAAIQPTLGLCVLASVAGYVWFVTHYPGELADTVKATYLLIAYPFLAIVTALWLARVRDHRPRLACGIVIAMLVVLSHNAPTLVTHVVREVW